MRGTLKFFSQSYLKNPPKTSSSTFWRAVCSLTQWTNWLNSLYAEHPAHVTTACWMLNIHASVAIHSVTSSPSLVSVQYVKLRVASGNNVGKLLTPWLEKFHARSVYVSFPGLSHQRHILKSLFSPRRGRIVLHQYNYKGEAWCSIWGMVRILSPCTIKPAFCAFCWLTAPFSGCSSHSSSHNNTKLDGRDIVRGWWLSLMVIFVIT